jgi:hypothetical protein
VFGAGWNKTVPSASWTEDRLRSAEASRITRIAYGFRGSKLFVGASRLLGASVAEVCVLYRRYNWRRMFAGRCEGINPVIRRLPLVAVKPLLELLRAAWAPQLAWKIECHARVYGNIVNIHSRHVLRAEVGWSTMSPNRQYRAGCIGSKKVPH